MLLPCECIASSLPQSPALGPNQGIVVLRIAVLIHSQDFMFYKVLPAISSVVRPLSFSVLLCVLKLGPFQSPPAYTVLLPVQLLLLFSSCLNCAKEWAARGEAPVGELSASPPPLPRTPHLTPQASALIVIPLPGAVVDEVEGSITQRRNLTILTLTLLVFNSPVLSVITPSLLQSPLSFARVLLVWWPQL